MQKVFFSVWQCGQQQSLHSALLCLCIVFLSRFLQILLLGFIYFCCFCLFWTAKNVSTCSLLHSALNIVVLSNQLLDKIMTYTYNFGKSFYEKTCEFFSAFNEKTFFIKSHSLAYFDESCCYFTDVTNHYIEQTVRCVFVQESFSKKVWR